MNGEKACPIMSKPVAMPDPHGGSYIEYAEAVCIRTRCQFWIEGKNCAYVIGALKN